jgi:glyoxylase-like metal-dependent hydrolase (beta-lactamase superfamily II)
MKQLSRWLALAGLAIVQPAVAQTVASTLETKALRSGLHVVSGAGGNVAVAVGSDGIFIVDDKLEAAAPELVAAIAHLHAGPIRFVINTHWHFDHVGGNERIAGRGAVVVAHDNVRARMSRDQFIAAVGRQVPASPAIALPVITFAEALTLHLNGDDIEVHHVPNAHTDGDSIVNFRAANVVHMGDTFFNGLYPFIDLSSGGSIDGMIAAAGRVLDAIDAETIVIPGHGPVTDRTGLARYRDMLVEARRRVVDLIAAGRSREQVLSARPLADYDAELGAGRFKPEDFLGQLYDDLVRSAQSPTRKSIP